MTLLTPDPAAIPALVDTRARPRRSPVAVLVRFCRRQPLGALGLALVLIMAVTGLFAEWLAPYSPTSNDFAAMTEPLSWAHLLGTDPFGRDLLSRIIYGARTAMLVGFSSALIGGAAGLVLGVATAYFGGWLDLVLQGI